MCQMQVVVSQKEKQRHGSDTAKTRFGDTAEKQNDLTPKKKKTAELWASFTTTAMLCSI